MKVKKILVGILVFLFIVIMVIFYQRNLENLTYRSKGEKLIEKIENYKEDFGTLPESVMDLNVEPEMGEGPYYERLDSSKYTVYFNIGFDNNLIYYSDTGEWKEEP